MKYMIRDVFTCNRGKVPEYLELLKIVIGALKAAGFTERKVYADIAESMDTIFHEMEVDSLDAYFELERGFFVDMDAETKGLVDAYNDVTVGSQVPAPESRNETLARCRGGSSGCHFTGVPES